jgi:hypothetical protein
MSNLNRIEQNNAELRECIEIAESLPDAPVSVGGYDIATMQKLVEARGAKYLFYYADLANADISWLGRIDTSNITDMSYMFQSAKGFETVPQIDTSNVTNMDSIFRLSSLTTIPFLDTSNVKNARYAFSSINATEMPSLDWRKLTTIESMFESAKMVSIPDMDVPNITSVSSVFKNMTQLQTVGKFLTPKATYFGANFYGCTNLVTIEELDLRSATSVSNLFYDCSALTNLTVKNIKSSLQVGSGTSWGHLLTVDSLVGLCYELRDTGSLKTLTVGKANLDKLATVYVRSIEITDAMIAEDNLVDKKLPFERCESTDEGAMLIGDYVLLKNWKLA